MLFDNCDSMYWYRQGCIRSRTGSYRLLIFIWNMTFFFFSLKKYDLDKIEWCKKILVANIDYSSGGFIDDPQKCWDQGLVVVVGDRIRRRQVLLGFFTCKCCVFVTRLEISSGGSNVWTCIFVCFFFFLIFLFASYHQLWILIILDPLSLNLKLENWS